MRQNVDMIDGSSCCSLLLKIVYSIDMANWDMQFSSGVKSEI